MKKVIFLSCITTLFVLGSIISAQPSNPFHGKGFRHDKDRGADIENLRFLKMLEVLDMTDDQSDILVPLFHDFRRDLRELRKERRTIQDTLSYYLEQENAERDILKLIDDLHANLGRMQARTEEFFTRCKDTLTPYQLGRLVLFHERFERDVLEAIREFRGRGPGAPSFDEDGN